jgi:hypothetical protein
MALLANNASGVAVITDANIIPSQMPSNFIDPYSYAQQFQPELLPELVYKYGKGSITGFMRATGSGMKRTYESDQIQHAEAGRLSKHLSGVTISGNNFTFPEAHGLEAGRLIKFWDTNTEYQGIVTAVVSDTVVTVLSDTDDSWPAGPVNITLDFSSRFKKGADAFTQGFRETPDIIKNYSHIFKHHQDTTNSDLGHAIWVQTDAGPQWWNFEFARASAQFDNISELTAVFHRRATDTSDSAVAGQPQGMYGVKQIVEDKGNVFNDLITTIDQLSNIAFRLKQQGECRELNMWCNHQQMAAFRELSAGVNAAFLNGFQYGSFVNSEDMYLKLDFSGIKVDGVQFNFVSWSALDDPTMQAITGSNIGGTSFLGVPCGRKSVTMNGDIKSVSYLDMLFRKTSQGVREKETKFFGKLGTEVREDKSYVDWLSEGTIQLAGANNFFVGGTYSY